MEINMAKGKKINQVIDKIEDFIDRCKPQPFHADNICVPREQLFAMLEELRASVPEEIDACAKMIANREQIIVSAQKESDTIIDNAKKFANKLVNENQITQAAMIKANSIEQQAYNTRKAITDGAYTYANDRVEDVQRVLDKVYEEMRNSTEQMMSSLKDEIEVVATNKKQLELAVDPEVQEPVSDSNNENSGKDNSLQDENSVEDDFLDDAQEYNDEDDSDNNQQ
jgi:vacuolar-type H+-ATPase subunit H